ncbi:MAG: energy transducer TonB [Acidobacteriota bacterium]|nr:energy transducer TonB [Acidobacteriota bacterium]
MINKLSKFKLLILLFGILFTVNSHAQTPVCNLQFDIFDLNGEQPIKAIGNVKAILTDLATKKTKEFSALTETPLFNNLTSGKYKIEIIKNGFQRRVKEFELNCKTAVETVTISKVLYLQKGDSKKVTKFDSKVFGTADEGKELKAESNESVINSNARIIAKPKYPASARAVRAVGSVQVQVTLDEDGEVVSADAINGHPLLRQAAETAAKESRFAPTLFKGQPVIVTGIIVYNFNP